MSLRTYLYIEISLALKVRNEISFAFFYQVSVKRVLLVDRDQFAQSLVGEARAGDSDENLRAGCHSKNQVSAIRFGIIVGWLQMHLTGEAILFAQIVSNESAGSLNALGVIRFARLQRGSFKAGSKRAECPLQSGGLFGRKASYLDVPKFCLPAQGDMKNEISQLMSFIEFTFTLNLRHEISVVNKKTSQRRLRILHPALFIGFLRWIVNDLE